MVSPVYMEESVPPSFSYSARGTESANRLVASFGYLCSRGARKFVRAGIERCDLEQVAAIGLIKASRRYDRATGTPFEAYAWLMIVGELGHYVRDHDYPVRIPRGLLALERNVLKAQDELAGRLRRSPTDAEIGAELALPAATVARARALRGAQLPVRYDDVEPETAARENALANEDRMALASAFAALGTLERRVVGGMYLLGLTQSQLARTLDLPPKRVSRIHLGALARMRRAWPA